MITGYTIVTSTLETSNISQIYTTATSIIIADLIPFTTYEATVAAHTVLGMGPFSPSITVQTAESGQSEIVHSALVLVCIYQRYRLFAAPNTSPENVVVSILSSTTLHLSWMAPSTEQNGIIREYYLRLIEVESGMLLTYTAATTSLTIQPLHPFYSYQCRVSAYTVARGPFTDAVTVTMPEDGEIHGSMYLLWVTHIMYLSQFPVDTLKILVQQ